MDFDGVGWVVRRHVIDAVLDDIWSPCPQVPADPRRPAYGIAPLLVPDREGAEPEPGQRVRTGPSPTP